MRLLVFLLAIYIEFYLLDCYKERTTCPLLYLENGRVRYTSSGRIAKFKCNGRYQLVGDESATCSNGQWSSSFHVCAKRDCTKLPKLYHGSIIYTNRKSVAKPVCDSNFTLLGSPLLYCTDSGWNATLPSCIGADTEQFKPCHFETGDPMHCHWLLSPSTYKWIVYPSSSDTSFNSKDDNYPPYDHTLGPHPDGHYLLLIRNRAIWKSQKNSTGEARFISPLFPATDKSKEDTMCLMFYYYLPNTHAGMLKVIVNEDVVWANVDPVHREWTKQIIGLQNQHQPFRIILEGLGIFGYDSGLAIDDLSIRKGTACHLAAPTLNVPVNSAHEILSTTNAELLTFTIEATTCGTISNLDDLHAFTPAEINSVVESVTNASTFSDIYTSTTPGPIPPFSSTISNSLESAATNDITTSIDVSESFSNYSEIITDVKESSSEIYVISTNNGTTTHDNTNNNNNDNNYYSYSIPTFGLRVSVAGQASVEKITSLEENRILMASTSADNKTENSVDPTIDTISNPRRLIGRGDNTKWIYNNYYHVIPSVEQHTHTRNSTHRHDQQEEEEGEEEEDEKKEYQEYEENKTERENLHAQQQNAITDKSSHLISNHPYVICAVLGTLFVIIILVFVLLISWKVFDQCRIRQNADECNGLLIFYRSNTASSDMTATFPLTIVKKSGGKY